MNMPQHPPVGQVVIKPQPQEQATGTAGGEPKRRWSTRARILAAAAAILVVATVIVLVVVLGSGPDDGDFEGAGGNQTSGEGSSDSGVLDLDTSGTTTAPVGGPADGAAADPATGGDPASGAAPAPDALPAGSGGAILVPRAGSYTFNGSGSEKTMPFLPNPVPQGPKKPASVTHTGGGCWSLELEQNPNHTDESIFCAGGDSSLSLQKLVTRQTNDLGAFGPITSTLTTTCTPLVTVVAAGMAAGARFPLDCVIDTVVKDNKVQAPARMTATGTVTFAGVENVDVGGKPVAAYHLRQQVRLLPTDGAPEGSRESDVWLATDDGMVLREVRSMTASVKLFGQTSTYVETSEHTLASR